MPIDKTTRSPRLAAIGFGAMARSLASALARGDPPYAIGAALLPPSLPQQLPDGTDIFHDADGLIAWRPDLVVECASHEAVRDTVPSLLAAGIDVVVASVGALGDPQTLDRLRGSAEEGGARVIVAHGAVGGLDVLSAAACAGLDRVVYTGRKPPRAWAGTPASERFEIGRAHV